MTLTAIVAVSENNAIGKDNDLLWHLPLDMRFFKDKTTGHPIITGRKNYESIPEKFRPLPNRTNIVVTRQVDYDAPGAVVKTSLDAAIDFVKTLGQNEVFVIGGGQIFEEVMPLLDKIYFTRVHHNFEADTFFPVLNENDWEEVASEHYSADARHLYSFTFQTFERRK